MNPNLPPLGQYSSTTIDRDALCNAFKVPAGLRFNDRSINLWLSQNVPGMENYQTPDTLDMDLLRRCMLNGADASIEAINESLDIMAGVLDGSGSEDSSAQPAEDQSPKSAAGSPIVPAPAAGAIIGLNAPGLAFRAEVAARLRAAGY